MAGVLGLMVVVIAILGVVMDTDGMGNEVAKSYHAWPDRVYLIDQSGHIGVASPRGPVGIKRALKRVSRWLEAHRKTLDGGTTISAH